MNFSKALDALCTGHRLTRRGWNGVGMWVEMQRPDEYSKMTEPYLFLNYPDGRRSPWVPSQGDLFATDWTEV